MTSTISCNSKTHQFLSMYLWSMRKNMATIITYSLFLLFSFPLLLLFYNTLTAANIIDRADFLIEANNTVYPIIFGCILMLFTLLVSVFMFSYLHKKRSVDMFGALPVSRRWRKRPLKRPPASCRSFPRTRSTALPCCVGQRSIWTQSRSFPPS